MDAGRPEYATRADLSMTLFISEPESYDGGELVISSSVGESAFKPAAGTLVIYPSGELHWVTKVTRGSRIAAVSWIQSYVKSAQRRTILYEMDSLSDLARARGADQEEIDLSVSVYHKLLRLWSET
jgi:PKHD-type hydroxylase